MAEYLIQDTSLVAIADAIRDKTGSAETLSPSQMVSEIENMELGSDVSVVTATAADVLSPKIFVDANGEEITGTIATKTASNLSASGATVSVPAGYYASNVSKAVSTATQATPSITVSSAGLITASATQSAGYVAAGTKSATKQLTTKAATTITPGTSAKTAVAKNVYTTGAITVAGDADLKAANIKSGVNIFGVAGTLDSQSAGAISKGTIVVTYPSGATCTVYNSSGTTYTALDTSGAASFIVAAGTWTVKITKSGQTTKTKSVTVVARKYAEVELSFWNGTLYNAGNEYTDITGGWASYAFYRTGSTYGAGEVTKNSANMTIDYASSSEAVAITNAISLAGYTKLNFTLTTNSLPESFSTIYITSAHGSAPAAHTTFSGTGTKTLTFDPDALSGKYYVGIGGGVATYVTAQLVITKAWLS